MATLDEVNELIRKERGYADGGFRDAANAIDKLSRDVQSVSTRVENLSGGELLNMSGQNEQAKKDALKRHAELKKDRTGIQDAITAETDEWRDLGGIREQSSYEMKHLALTNPNLFMQLRAKALEKVKAQTVASFNATSDAYLRAGYSKEDAKRAGLRTADETKAVQLKALKLRFGEAEDSVVTEPLRRVPPRCMLLMPRQV